MKYGMKLKMCDECVNIIYFSDYWNLCFDRIYLVYLYIILYV